MTSFQYKALTQDGDTIEGSMDALDEQSVILHLQNLGHLPIKASASKKHFSWSISALLPNKKNALSKKKLLAFTQNLSTLINAGLTVDHSFKSLLNTNSDPADKKILSSLYEGLQAGKPLSAALSKHPDSFDKLYISMVKSGEASGDLGLIFERLSKHIEKTQALRSSVISTLIYPAILVVISLLSLIFLLSFVIPKFIPMFEGSENSLPSLSRLVFSLSEVFQAYWWLLPVLVLCIVFISKKLIKNSLHHERFHLMLLKLPLIGFLTKSHQCARFARTTATLLNNGLNLIDSIKLAKETISHSSFIKEISASIEGVQSGKKLSAMFTNSIILPELAVDLIRVGEETGKLPMMLSKIADIYEKETDKTLKRLLIFLEPIIILGLGVLIALIILSVLLAMLSLNNLVI